MLTMIIFVRCFIETIITKNKYMRNYGKPNLMKTTFSRFFFTHHPQWLWYTS
jgi:hypothetical protein